jgi:hypothetical protein
MSIKIKGTTYTAEVDINGSLQATGPLNENLAGFSALTCENDAGTITGTTYRKSAEIDEDYRLITSVDQLIFNENFPGAAFNTTQWNNPTTTATATVTAGFATLNAGLSTASGAVAQLYSRKHIPTYKQNTTRLEWEAQFSQTPVANNFCEMGLFISPVGVGAITDGAFFRFNSSSEFRCIVSNNGTELQSGTLNFTTLLGANVTNTFLIYSNSTSVTFWVNNIMVFEQENAAGSGSSTASLSLPIAFRIYNSAATSAAQVMKIGNISCCIEGSNTNKPWGHIISGNNGHISQGQTGATLGSTAIYTNAAAAAAAALSNTTAAAANTGLGGIINVLPTLTVGTDGILCSYQVPIGTSALPGRSLYITGVSIDAGVTVVLAGGPCLFAQSIAYGHTAVSLATAESATTKAPRRIPLGLQTFAAAAAVGTVGARLQDDYTVTPIHIMPGEFIQIASRNLGVVTTTGAITFVVTFTGYWE